MTHVSSQQAHRLRINTVDYMRKWLKERKIVEKDAAVIEIMRVFMFSRQTAGRYVNDFIDLGIVKNSADQLVYLNGDEGK